MTARVPDGGFTDRARLLYQQQRYELAAADLRHQLTADPTDGEAHALLCLCLCEMSDLKGALEEAREAIRVAPEMGFAHFTHAAVLLRQGKTRLAETAVYEAIRIAPWDVENFFLLSRICLMQENWRGALQAAEQGLSLQSDHIGCTNVRSQAMLKLGRRAEALQTVETALRLAPDSAFSHANKGWALIESGKHREAMRHFREALRLEPDLDWAKQGVVTALKAQNPGYRIVLNYFLWMARLPRQARYGVIFGLWLLNQVVMSLGKTYPVFHPYAAPLEGAYLVFCFMTWTADPLCNALLRFHPFGKLVLTPKQTVVSTWVGGLFATGLLSLLVYVFRQPREGWLVLGFGCLILTWLTAALARWSGRFYVWALGGIVGTLLLALVIVAADAGL